MNKNRIIVIFSVLFVLLCSLSAVAASDLNSTDAIAGEITDETIAETADSDAESEKILTTINEEQESILNVTGEEQESVLDATDDESEEWGTFTELRQLISDTLHTKEIKLNKNYRSTGSGGSSDEIVINREVTIDGNGHTIDCAGKSTAFVVSYSYVNLKNMRITGFADTSKSHLYAVTVQPYVQNCIIENCIFEDNSYSVLSMQGTFSKIVDCIFRNNSANGAELVYLTTSNHLKDKPFHRNYMDRCIFVDNGKITSDGKFDTDKLVLLGDDFTVAYSRFENNVAEKGIVYFGDYRYISTVNTCLFGAAETGKDYGVICRNGIVRGSIFCTPDIKGNVINGVSRLEDNLWFDGTKSYEIPERVVESEGYDTRYEPYIVTGYKVVKEYEIIFLVKTYYVPSIPKEVRLGDTIQLKLMFLKSNTSLLQMPTGKTVTFQIEFSDSNLNSTNITFTNGISTPFNYTALDGEEGTATILYNGAIITSIKLKHTGEYDSFTLLKHAISKASNEIVLTHDYKFYSSLDDKIAFTVDKDITINGDGHTIDGCNGANGIFNFAGGRNITVKNLNFVNFKGLVVNAESSGNDQITFINCTFKNIGGGIKSNKITGIYDCKFEDSTATAINLYSTQNTASIIDNSIFENCKSKYDGGAGYINSPTIITDSQFKNNYARNGGGLYIDAQNCAVDNCEFIGDTADYLAGGVFFNNTGCNLTNSLFKSNSAASNVPFYFKTTQGTVENNTETNNTISKNSFRDLMGIITSGGNVVNLEIDYKFKYGSKEDSKIGDGIPIEKNLIINGNGHTIDGDAYATFFEIYGKTLEVTFNNINFVNGLGFGIYIKSAKSVSFNNCTFHSIEGQESTDAVIYIDYNWDESVRDSVLINGCRFIYNDIYNIIFANPGDYALTVKDSVFVNPDSTYDVFIKSHNTDNYLDYNWWGNTEYNFTSMPKVNVKLNNWYFLNDTTVKSNRATISLNNLYDNVAKTVTEDANCSLTDVPVEFIGKDLVIDDAVIKHGILTVSYKTIKKPAFLTTVIYGINNTVNITEKGQFDLLQELIDNATGDIMNLNRDYTLTEDIDSVGGIIINKDNLIINGNGHTINALGISNLFNILSDNVKLMNLILINGNGTISQSSPIQWRGNYGTIENCTVSNNFAERFGAITWTGTMGGIINSTFNNNRGLSSGGAIFIEGIGVSIVNSNFTGNVALRGASIYSNNEYTRIDNCKFIKNDASDGGAVYLNDEYGRIRYSIFENNTGRYGGAVYCNDINDAVTTSMFAFNNARYGGAVYWNKRYGSLADCEFASNTATEDGGAIYWNANYGTVDSSSFEKNTAKRGGAIYWDYDYGKVIGSTFIRNTANDGGAIYFCEGNFIKNEQQTVDYSTFLENSAQNNGGAIYVAAKKSSIGNSSFIKNQAKNGGALYATFEDGTISQSVFISNFASDEGSAIYADEDSTPVNYCVFFEDNAKSIIYHDGSWFSSNLNADYNWWGNNISNFNQKLANVNDDVDVNNWYVLDMTMNEGTANITLNSLFENNKNKITTDVNCRMPQINITLTNENLTVDDSVILGENGYVEVEYLPKAIKGSLKASFETASVTRNEEFLPSSTTITTAEDEFIYGNITIEYEVINPTIINVTITNETGDIVFENLTSQYMVSPDLAVGTYTLTVTNMGNGSIVSSNDTKTFTVTKVAPTIMVVAEDVTYPGDVAVNVTSDVAGNYSVKIGNVGEEIYLTVNEVKQLTFSGLKADEYIINVTYDETGNHTQAFNDSVKVNVLKADSDVIIKNVTYLDYWNVIVEIELVNSDDFTAKLYQNATEISKITKNQTAIRLSDLTLGDYTLNITTIVDENHTQTTESLNIFVKYTPTINVATADVTYPGDVIVNVTSDATGKFTMKIRNNTLEFNLTEDVKTETFRFKGMEIGEYAINVTYQGNELYTAAFNDTVKVNVLKNNTAINSTVKIDGYHATITVNVNPNATGFVYLTYDDFACYLALENGSASFNNTLPVGDYNVSIKYLGDSLYNESSTSLEFVIVNPAKENTDISLEVISNENDVTYIVDVDSDATGIVKFEVTGTEEYTVYADVINGKAVLDDILGAGDYNLIATYMGDDRFNTNITTQTFTVKGHEKQDTPIDADVNITGYRTTITVNVNPNATGFVSINLGDTIAHIALTNGAGLFITNLAAGSYHADLTYLGDDDFNENSTVVTFTIVDPVKENTTISLEVTSNENDVNYTVDVNSNATGLVKFEINGTEKYTVYSDVINGKAILSDKLVVGNYTVIATYLGDSNYNSNVTSERFSIKGHIKQNATIGADVVINGYLVTVNVNVDSNATGFVELSIKDSVVYLALENGITSVNNTLPAGSYNIAIKYLGDDNYNENSTGLEFVIVDPVKENTDISLEVISNENDVAYIVDVDSDATGIVKFEVTGTEQYTVYVDVIDGNAILEDILDAGDYTVIATYMGDSRFNTNITSESFTVKGHVKQDTAIDADVNINGYRVTITVSVDSDASGFVRVKLGDTIANIELTDGAGSLVTSLAAGSYYVDLTYLGDDNYNENSTALTFTIVDPIKEDTPISLDVSSYENDVIYTVEVNSDATGLVKFKVTGTEEYMVYADVIDGKAILVDILDDGDYTIIATYVGDDKYNANVTSESFTIKGHTKQNTTIGADVKINGYIAEISVNVNPNATGFVELKTKDSTIYLALENGVASLNNTLSAGSYNFAVRYIGDDDYNENSTSLEFVIVDPAKENTGIALNVVIDENDVIYAVDVDSDATGLVKFEVTGTEEYTVYVDVINGGAVLEDILVAGDYTVIATYMGDARFNTNITTQTFTIKGHEKQDTAIDANVNINGYRVTITVNVDSDATGFVRVKLADTIANIELTEGTGSLITNLAAGSYYVDLTYLGDDDFNMNSTALTFTIVDPLKEDTPISLDVSSYENDVIYTVEVNSDATGLVKFKVTGTEEYMVYADVIDGKAILVDTLDDGDYTVIATYVGDDKYNANVTSESFTIKGHTKQNTTIDANVKINGYIAEISVNVNPNATGFVELTTKDSIIYLALKNGVASVNNTLSAGSYNFAIRYIGDDDYNENSTSLEFVIVDPAKENTDIALNIVIDENDVIYAVDVDSDATGIVKFEVTGTEEYTVYVDVINGGAVLEDILVAGDYTVIATYMGDARFNTNITTQTFTIKGHEKQDTTIDADANINGYRVTITVNVDSDATGFVRVKLADTIANIELTNGAGSLITNLAAGSYYVDLTYLGDDDFNMNSTALTFTIVDPLKEDTPISLDVSSYENDVVYTVNVNSDATGLVKFKVTGTEEYTVYADVINGKAILVDTLDDGDYTVIATYVGDDKYNANVTSESFTIKGHTKQNTTINADVKINGYIAEISVNVNPNATGFVELKTKDSTIYLALENGVASLNNTLSAGSYNFAIRYIGDDDYNENSTSLEFVIVDPAKENTDIALNIVIDENDVIYAADVDSDATGIVKFEVTGTEEYTIYVDVINGKAILEDILDEGDYTVVATYMGDARFNTNITTQTFTIKGHEKQDTAIDADVNINGYRVTITVNVDSDATGFVRVKLADTIANIELTNGAGSLITTLAAGSYHADLTYIGDDNYNENSTTLTFTVVDPLKEDTPISLDVSSYENDVVYTVEVNSDATGLVKFKVTGTEEYTVYADVINGKAILVDTLDDGDYTVIATYVGDDKYNANVTSESFNIKGHTKQNTTIDANVKINGYLATINVNVNLNATGFIELTTKDSTIYLALENGAASLNNNLPAGSYNIAIRYLGDENYNENNTSLEFVIVDPAKENTTIKLDVSSVEDYATFIVNVNPNATGIVKFEVSGTENYTVYADVINGVALMKDFLTPGDYIVVATYMGDDMFNSNITSESFTVKGHIKNDTPITADAKVNGNRVTITVNVDENATGFVGLKQSGSIIYIAVKNGVATYATTLPARSYNVEVTYTGDDDYNENSTRVLFTIVEVAKDNTPIEIEVTSIEDYVTFAANVNPNATGIVKFEVSGTENYTVYADVINGIAIMEDVLTAGDYTVIATYMGDDRFNQNYTVESFTVSGHVMKDVTINCDVVVNGNEVAVTVNVNESSATGFVEFNVAGKKYYAPVENGKAVLVSDFLAGTYMGNVQYLGDENFNTAGTFVYFNVVEQNITLENTTLDIIVNSEENDVSIVVMVNESATGLVEVIIGDTVVYLPINNGAAGYEIVLPGGEYNVTATYLGDAKFNPNSTSKAFVVYDHIKKNTTITSDVVVDGYNVIVTVNVDSKATGFVEFIMNGNSMFGEVKDGKAVINNIVPAGKYVITANYLGDDDFNANSTEIEVTVEEIPLKNTTIDAKADIFENNVTITVNVDENATGFVEFYVTGAEEYTVYVTLVGGKAILDDVLTAGDYTVLITYLGDLNFNMNSTTQNFTVIGHIKNDTSIKAISDVEGNTVTIDVDVNKKATGFVTIEILGQTFIVPVKDGKAVFTYDFNPGIYNANVVYLGDDDFNNASTTVSFTVIQQEVVLKNTTIDVIVDILENNVTMTANVDSLASGLIEFNIEGQSVYIAVNNGKAAYDTILPAGAYNVVVTYLGDSKFNANSTFEEFVVFDHIKHDTAISAEVSVDGNVATIVVNVNANATGFVEFNIDGEDVYAAIKDGNATYSIVLVNGDYNALITYVGDKNFNTNSTVKEFSISNIVPKATEVTNIAIGEDYIITARLLDVDGNPVKDAAIKYTVGNVSGSTKTDADGVFTINAQSDCVVFMEFEGNSTFLATNISIKIDKLENKKLGSEFNITEGVSIKTYAVDLKAGEIGCVEYFKLTDSNGNPIANASIKFAYKSVILNRTTDENGIVYLGINTYVAQTALCAMSYLGDETYNATFVAFSFDIQLKPISITAKAKTFKKSTKTKKYTITLKTQKCNSRDGKVYLSSGKKVTLKINGKTYTAKTNSKGQATFKITKLTKKGKYTATVKFAGDKTYKSASKSIKITIK